MGSALDVAVLTELFAYLSPATLLICGGVCRVWRFAGAKEYVWYRMAQRLRLRGGIDVDKEALWKEEASKRSDDDKYFVPAPQSSAPTWKELVLRQWCPHLVPSSVEECMGLEAAWSGLGMHLHETRCARCNLYGSSWICTRCQLVACGRAKNGHMLEHYTVNHHCTVIESRELQMWCFKCDRYLGESDSSDAERLRVLLIKRSLLCLHLFQHRQEQKHLEEELDKLLTVYHAAPLRFE
jgi:hypothetical protein